MSEFWRTESEGETDKGCNIYSEKDEYIADVFSKIRGDQIVACVNACAGINPEAVREMLIVLRRCCKYIRYISGLPLGRAEERDGRVLFEQAQAAIELAEEEV